MRGAAGAATIAMALSLTPSFQLSAQHFSVGPQIAFGDYREVSSDLHYRGSGIGAKATLEWKKFSADVVLSKVKYKPTSDGTATTAFDASEVDVRLRYYITGPVSAELGFINRKADPEFEAQSVGAVTALHFVIARAASLNALVLIDAVATYFEGEMIDRSVMIPGPAESGSITTAAPTLRSDISRATSLSLWLGPTVRTEEFMPSCTCTSFSFLALRARAKPDQSSCNDCRNLVRDASAVKVPVLLRAKSLGSRLPMERIAADHRPAQGAARA